ncbi:hypothetical protein CYMTET_15935 [Cymbomonas tetramitiformis]|uniref:PH domain-containing protein n=1 Tax=Cymbomonas tetramitiformis TaxID=36881 RepID=A0AAE0GDF9_9CHLO|nr:hypothetical protein CYMTET_15935 [Cymbomonas tetramitiformis]
MCPSARRTDGNDIWVWKKSEQMPFGWKTRVVSVEESKQLLRYYKGPKNKDKNLCAELDLKAVTNLQVHRPKQTTLAGHQKYAFEFTAPHSPRSPKAKGGKLQQLVLQADTEGERQALMRVIQRCSETDRIARSPKKGAILDLEVE